MLILTSMYGWVGVSQPEMAVSVSSGLMALLLLGLRRWGMTLDWRADFKFGGSDA